jgi:HSP20 family protein
MSRIRRNPFGVLFNEVNSVQEDLARLFGRMGPFAPGPGVATAAPVNVWEDDHALYVEVDLPGIDPAKLDITVTEGNQLAIQGERAAPEIAGATWVRQERPVGQFVREVQLSALVDADKVEARYENGVLRLTLPKHEAVKPRKIQVKSSGA